MTIYETHSSPIITTVVRLYYTFTANTQETRQSPIISLVVRLYYTPIAGTQDARQSPCISALVRLYYTPIAGVQETGQSPIIVLNVALYPFKKAGVQETGQSPIIEFSIELYKIVIELVKILSDGSETVINSKVLTPLKKIIGVWNKLEVVVNSGKDKTIIFVKIYDTNGNVIAETEFETTEFRDVGGSIGLYNDGKVYYDLFECRYT